MRFLNTQIAEVLHDETYASAPPAVKAAWWNAIMYSAEQENGGVIAGAATWSNLRCLRAILITRRQLLNSSPLLEVVGNDVHVWRYPVEMEDVVRTKRELARRNGAESRGRPPTRKPTLVPTSGPIPVRIPAPTPENERGRVKEMESEGLAPLAYSAGVEESGRDNPPAAFGLMMPEVLTQSQGFVEMWETEWLPYQLERNRGRRPTIITLEKHLQTCARLGAGKAISALKSAIEKGWAAPDENVKVTAFERPRDEAPDDWQAVWRERFPPEEYPDAPRYEEGQWNEVPGDHKQLIRDEARRRVRRSA